MAKTTRVQLAAQSHPGPRRTHNDDAVLVLDLATVTPHNLAADTPHNLPTSAHPGPTPATIELTSDAGIAFAVLSASGGFRWGRPGAEVAAEALRATLVGAALPGSLLTAMKAASQAIIDEVARDPRREGLSVVATLAAICGDLLHVVQLGDTRAYALQRGSLVQLTQDDTVINHAVALGIRPEHYPPGTVTRALGYGNTVEQASVSTFELRGGDVVLLCSRGLHTALDTGTLERALGAASDVASACAALQDLAGSAGARHNITAVLAQPMIGAG